MIHDAYTKPGGFRLKAEQWPRDPHVRRIARARGITLMAPNFVALEAVPARALLNHGVWRAWCPDCLGAAEDLWRDRPFFCMKCGNVGIGGAWRPVAWPENLAEIEAALAPYPSAVQNWEPWGEPRDLVADAEAWVEHAREMMDPEHGLTENEVGGADDPETYTTPVVAVTNAIITSSDANVDKGDIRYFRQFISANPAGAGLPLLSTGVNGGAFGQVSAAGIANLAVGNAQMAAGAAVANIGYTPVNKTGDSMSGSLSISANNGGPLLTLWQQNASGFSQAIYNAAQNAFDFFLDHSSLSVGVAISGVSLGLTGGATVGGTLGVTGALTGASTIQGTRLISTVSDGVTAPLTVHANQAAVTVANLRAASAAAADNATQLNSVAASSYARKDAASDFTTAPTINSAAVDRVQTGSYTGDSTSSRTITLSPAFTPKLVLIYKTTDHSMHIVTPGFGMAIASGASPAFSTDATTTNGFTVHSAAGSNTSGDSYSWVAWG